VLSAAIVLSLIGFAFHPLWFGSLVLMALLWGLMASDMRRSRDTDRVVPGAVASVVGEANEVAHAIAAATTTTHEPVNTSEGEQAHDELTRKELYDEAKELGVEGRSAMNKEELKAAIEDA
jgi:hypothetical protein